MARVRENEAISEWEEGDLVQGFALVARKEDRVDRNGRTYVDLELADATGRVNGKIWPDSPALETPFPEKAIVAYQGIVHLHREALQINLDRCRPVTPADRRSESYDEGRLLPSAPVPLDELWSRLLAVVPALLERPWARQLAERALEEWGEAFRVHPAARSIHHAYRGGLLHHTVCMLEVGVDAVERYEELDRDLVFLGLFLHDVGKLRELGALPRNEYTFPGELVGHVTMGAAMVRELAADLEIPELERNQLEHVLLAHQGRREWGSPVEPRTAEAIVVSQIDELDSKLAQLREARRDGGRGMTFLRPMGRSMWLGEDVEPAD